jgi:hypothetical protein
MALTLRLTLFATGWLGTVALMTQITTVGTIEFFAAKAFALTLSMDTRPFRGTVIGSLFHELSSSLRTDIDCSSASLLLHNAR